MIRTVALRELGGIVFLGKETPLRDASNTRETMRLLCSKSVRRRRPRDCRDWLTGQDSFRGHSGSRFALGAIIVRSWKHTHTSETAGAAVAA